VKAGAAFCTPLKTTGKLSANATAVVAHHAGFLFVNNITTKATGAVLVVLIALYVGTQAFSGSMMSVGQTRNQRMMAIGLPFVFVLFVIQFAAGLLVYWIATNVTMIPQQLYMLRKYGRPGAPTTAVTSDGGTTAVRNGGALEVASASNGRGSTKAATQAVRKPAAAPPHARQRQRKKRSGRRR
jgi:YidC/Oxa1 family membrane protein insertase